MKFDFSQVLQIFGSHMTIRNDMHTYAVYTNKFDDLNLLCARI